MSAADGIIQCDPCSGTLTLDGVDMNTPAWCVVNIAELWVAGPITRGKNVVVPGAIGARAYPLRIDVAQVSLLMLLTGICDSTGAKYADPWRGLQANVDFLMSSVVFPPDAPTAARAGVLTLPDGSTRAAPVQVNQFKIGSSVGPVFSCSLECTLPGGRFL